MTLCNSEFPTFYMQHALMQEILFTLRYIHKYLFYFNNSEIITASTPALASQKLKIPEKRAPNPAWQRLQETLRARQHRPAGNRNAAFNADVFDLMKRRRHHGAAKHFY